MFVWHNYIYTLGPKPSEMGMPQDRPGDPKRKALLAQGSLNPRPKEVTDTLFLGDPFFDPRDLVQASPHRFRHAMATHLVASGIDVTVIRSWLGHVSLDTTNHYAQASVETKRQALEAVDPAARGQKLPSWKRNADLLTWLDSL